MTQCSIICLVCSAFALIVLGIITVVFSFVKAPPSGLTCTLKNETMTHLESDIGIKTWLHVSGGVGCGIGIYIILSPLIANTLQKYTNKIDSFLFGFGVVILLFNFAWNIVGSVLFWQHCINKLPETLNNFMYARLIISYIFLCFI